MVWDRNVKWLHSIERERCMLYQSITLAERPGRSSDLEISSRRYEFHSRAARKESLTHSNQLKPTDLSNLQAQPGTLTGRVRKSPVSWDMEGSDYSKNSHTLRQRWPWSLFYLLILDQSICMYEYLSVWASVCSGCKVSLDKGKRYQEKFSSKRGRWWVAIRAKKSKVYGWRQKSPVEN